MIKVLLPVAITFAQLRFILNYVMIITEENERKRNADIQYIACCLYNN